MRKIFVLRTPYLETVASSRTLIDKLDKFTYSSLRTNEILIKDFLFNYFFRVGGNFNQIFPFFEI